jgi:hypothetical protein
MNQIEAQGFLVMAGLFFWAIGAIILAERKPRSTSKQWLILHAVVAMFLLPMIFTLFSKAILG